MKNISYLLALHSIDGLGPIRLKTLLEYFKDPKTAWEAERKEFLGLGIPEKVIDLLIETRKKLEPLSYEDSIKKSGIKWMTVFDEDYPKSLKEIYDPPVLFYYKGEILPEDRRAIGVVGTRKMTGYGRMVTERFTRELVSFGFTIISGLARGVDTQAHKSALDGKGRTLAVLGGGLNSIFPPENIGLSELIANGCGTLISEYPPDYPSLAGNFPSRNRIISGLSLAVLVTEAAQDSGSLITARLAVDQGKDVFAVPGPITSDLSKGPAQLIQQGAKLVTCVEDILEELGMEKVKSKKEKEKNYENLSAVEQAILGCLENEQKHVDDVVRELKKSSSEVSAALVKMEIMGFVKNLGGGNYCINRTC